MIEETGKVVAVSQDEAWVQTLRQSTCQSCSAQKGCGQKLLNAMSAGQAQQIRVGNSLGVKVGDEVVVGIPESALLKASVVVYLIPLLAMMGAAVGARAWLSLADGWVALAGFIGLAAGFGVARRFSARRRDDDSFHPKLLRRVGFASDLLAGTGASAACLSRND